MTPKSITSKLLHCITTLTMFYRYRARRLYGCNHHFTVAGTFFCLVALINGSKYATDCFITRADFTTCGRNILPSPNKSPTTSMPAINGPSITSNGLGNVWQVVIPFTRACFKSSPAGQVHHSATESTALFLNFSPLKSA